MTSTISFILGFRKSTGVPEDDVEEKEGRKWEGERKGSPRLRNTLKKRERLRFFVSGWRSGTVDDKGEGS